MTSSWPTEHAELESWQRELAACTPALFTTPTVPYTVAGVFICFPLGGSGCGQTGEAAWAAAAAVRGQQILDEAVVEGEAGAPYAAGYLAAREGPLLERAFRTLRVPVDLLLVNSTGRDHPRGAGLALHLGAVVDTASIGVTHRPLVARGDWPPDAEGARTALLVAGQLVGFWLRRRRGARPLAIHAAWRTTPQLAATIVHELGGAHRTPLPLRAARKLAREARALGQSRALGAAGPLRGR